MERSIIMNEYFSPLDSFVRELKGNIRFLDNMLTNTGGFSRIIGIIGSVGLLVAMALYFK
jgi:hypothetical protein